MICHGPNQNIVIRFLLKLLYFDVLNLVKNQISGLVKNQITGNKFSLSQFDFQKTGIINQNIKKTTLCCKI